MKTFLTLVLAVLVAACGGGGSSDGAGGGANPTTGPGGGGNPFAGRYVGTATLTARAQGMAPLTDTVPLTVEITSGGIVTFIDEGGVIGHGQLNGSAFDFTNLAADSFEGITCSGTQSFTGMISNATITGTVSGRYQCQRAGTSIPVSLDGTYSVSLARSRSPSGGGTGRRIMDVVHEAVRR